jgi:hypothetical protein
MVGMPMSAWVNRVILAVGRPLPVFPQEPTSSGRPGTSEICLSGRRTSISASGPHRKQAKGYRIVR